MARDSAHIKELRHNRPSQNSWDTENSGDTILNSPSVCFCRFLRKTRLSALPNISVTSLRYPAKPQPQNPPQNWISFVAKLGWLPTPVRRAGGDFLSPCFHQSEAFPTEQYSWYVLIMVDAFAPPFVTLDAPLLRLRCAIFFTCHGGCEYTDSASTS